jgi:hypothetical protein
MFLFLLEDWTATCRLNPSTSLMLVKITGTIAILFSSSGKKEID